MNLKTKAKYYVLSTPILRRAAIGILNTPFIVDNPIYKYVYRKQINRVVKAHLEKPQVVNLEVTNTCNLRCVNCPNKDMQRKRGFMEMETYEKVIDECVKLGISNIYLSGVGEPTLHRLLVEQVAYAKTRGVKVLTLYTNATLLTPQLSEELIRAGLDRLNVSIDAATSKTYSKIRLPGNLEVVEENLRSLIDLKAKIRSQTPQVVVKFMRESGNAAKVGLFKRKWKGLANEVFISFPHNWGGAITIKKPEWRGSVKRDPCSMIFRLMSVCWDGKVSLCCLDSEAEVLLGDVRETSIKEIWHSPNLQDVRQAHLDADFGRIPLCAKCSIGDVWWLY